jgi:hypothetical protein
MKALLLKDRIYIVEETPHGQKLREVLGYGEHLEIHYKIWVAQMELYCPCTNNVNSGDIVEGMIYTITDKAIAFVEKEIPLSQLVSNGNSN